MDDALLGEDHRAGRVGDLCLAHLVYGVTQIIEEARIGRGPVYEDTLE